MDKTEGGLVVGEASFQFSHACDGDANSPYHLRSSV